jgi:DNA repair ATPase RecN
MNNIPFNDNSLTLSDKINIIQTLSDKINIIQESIFGHNATHYYLEADNSIISQLGELKENINALNTAAGFDHSYFPTISNIQSIVNDISTHSENITNLITTCNNLKANTKSIEHRITVLESNNY